MGGVGRGTAVRCEMSIPSCHCLMDDYKVTAGRGEDDSPASGVFDILLMFLFQAGVFLYVMMFQLQLF